MSQSKEWPPQEDAKLMLVVENFVEKIDEATAKAKLAPDTFLTQKSSAQEYIQAQGLLEDAEKEANRLRTLANGCKDKMNKNLREVAKQLKNTVGVNPEALSLLGLGGTATAPLAKVAAQAPTLVMQAERGVVKGRYTKHGHQGIDLYSCRTGESDFTLVGRFNMSRLEDPRPNRTAGLPEQRDYYAVFVDKDKQVGSQSPTVSVVVGSRPG